MPESKGRYEVSWVETLGIIYNEYFDDKKEALEFFECVAREWGGASFRDLEEKNDHS